MREYFKDKYAEELIRDTFNRHSSDMIFSHYSKYEFYWESEGNLNFKIRASYGGDSDRIYRYSVCSGDTLKVSSLQQLKNNFSWIEIHNYTNELLYSWED